MRRDVPRLFFLSLAVRLVVAALIFRPGYMDPSYYAAGAVNLAEGGGLSEPFIWNYLDDPPGIPHPGFLYWMPFPSLLAAPFAALFPGSFFALQIPFAFLSALLPLVGYVVALGATGARRHAWIAGLLVLFSGFFFPYWTLPETFAPFAIFGALALWLAGNWKLDAGSWTSNVGRWLLVGLLVGLAHLTRPDGVLLLPVVALASLFSPQSRSAQRVRRLVIGHSLLVMLAYLLSMAPWFARNMAVVGTPLSPAGAKTLWLTTYDDLFCCGCDLSPRSYLAWGWGNILRSKLWAAGVNIERFLGEDCLVFLLPFVLVGLYRLRRHPLFVSSSVYLFLVYLAHSLAFTFPGPRGGFFHASAPALPFLFAASAEGLEATVRWAAQRRRWNWQQALSVFAVAAVVAAVILSGYVAAAQLPGWRSADAVYQEVGRWLTQREVEKVAAMVANPPAFWYHAGYPAVVVPAGDVDTLLAVADRHGVAYVLLDRNRPAPLAELHAGVTSHPRLQPVMVWGEGESQAVLYEVKQ
jgi:4-amino-4-deoxy-L-arabinose transferase-like glycosyltransferase